MMENGEIKINSDSEAHSPLEEDSFRERITENRHKLRASGNQNGYGSETETEWETEVSDVEDTNIHTSNAIQADGDGVKGIMGRSSGSSSSSSSSSTSESSDSENEDVQSRYSADKNIEASNSKRDSSSDSSDDDKDEDREQILSHADAPKLSQGTETPHEPFHDDIIAKDHSSSSQEEPPEPKLPIVLDTSSSSSESETEDSLQVQAGEMLLSGDNKEPVSSSSSSSEDEDDRSNHKLGDPNISTPTLMHEGFSPKADINPPGPSKSDETSSSDDEHEDAGANIETPAQCPPEVSMHDGLHGEDAGNNVEDPTIEKSSSSSSSSESESDDETAGGPLVIRQKDDAEESVNTEKEAMATSLRKALEERERELQQKKQEEAMGLGARKPSEPRTMSPDYMPPPSPDAFDFNGDPSLRARTAFDFDEPAPELPPKLPPKQRDIPPIVAPEIGVHREKQAIPRSRSKSPNSEVHPNIFHVKDKTASLGRGMWSEDENDSGYRPRHQSSSHPPPDRVIDFSNNPDGDHSLKRSRSRNRSGRKRSTSRKRSREKRQSRSRSPSGSRTDHRVIDFSRKPYEDPQDAINRQAMVSLHANTYDTDAYDSVQETGDELNKLIEKANSLGYHHKYPDDQEDIFQKKKIREKKLDSKHPDAFAKIVAPIPLQQSPQTVYRASVPDQYSSDNSKRSSRSLSKKKRKQTPPVEAVDGDDEISIAESDINRFQSLSPPPEKTPSSLPFVTEIYPSDYTEFESFSEAELPEKQECDRHSSFSSDNTVQEPYNPALQTGGESAYDTVADLETDGDFAPKAKLNPIVSANFQICSDLSGSKSFPARLREGKAKKPRPGLDHLAIPLHQTTRDRKNVYPSSLPYFHNDFDDELERVPRRTGSVDDLGGIHPINPSIIVHRQATNPKGYRPELVPEVMVQSAQQTPPALPEKKKKKEKKPKESTEKPAPQIHFSVAQREGESASNVNNNLQINLLPSDDPNVINLNIRSASVNQSGPQSLPAFSYQPQPYPTEQPYSLSQAHQTPVTTMMHATPTASTTISPADNQHRVVDVPAPPMVVTGDDVMLPAPATTNGGVVLAGGVVTEILPNPVLSSAAQQFPAQPAQFAPYPTVSLGAQPNLLAPQASQSVPAPPVAASAPVVNTAVSSAPVQQPPLQPNNDSTVVDINTPWPLPEDRHGSLPNSLRDAKASGRMHHGDSGIDLTVHDRSRQQGSRTPKPRRSRRNGSRSSQRDSSSSSDEGSRRRRRNSSRKQLKSNDYLANAGPSNEYMEWYRAKHLKPSCCYLFMKHLMFAINLLFTIVGLGLVGLGIWGLVKLHHSGITDPSIIFLDPMFFVLVVGFVVTLVSFHGAAGFVRDNICMLKTFGSFLVTLFILCIVGGIVFWSIRARVKEFTENTYSQLIQQYDPETRVALTYSIDIMQSSFECCGITQPGRTQWNKNDMFKCPSGVKCPLPASCCRSPNDPSFKCVSSSELSYSRACIDTMTTAVADATPIIIGVWVGIWALMVLELICIYFMCKEIVYLQKIRNYIRDPIKYMKSSDHDRNGLDDESEESSENSNTETSSSEEEYRRKRRKDRKRKKDKRNGRSGKRKKADLGRRTNSRRGRRGSYRINKTFSIQDERGRRSHRGSSRSRSRSRSRRGSY